VSSFFLFAAPSTPAISTLSLHDALPIYPRDESRFLLQHSIVTVATALFCGARTTIRSRGEKRLVRQLRKQPLIGVGDPVPTVHRSEEHTSELQSRSDLVCRLLLEKKKKI